MAIKTQTKEEREAVKAAALDYLTAGLSVLPLGADKKPVGKWEEYQTERATPGQASAWNSPAVGIVGGAISGNLWILDFDKEAEELYPAWRALLAAKYPALAAALEGAPVARTSKGYHVYMRLPEPRGNELLAGYYAEADGKRKVEKLIETRGEGGYVVAPPSPHPSGARYQWLRPLEAIPTLSPELTEQLLAACRSFDRREPRHEPAAAAMLPATRPAPLPAGSHGDRPTLEEIREMLRHINYPTSYEEWIAVLMAIHSAYPGPEGLAAAVEWREWEPGEIAQKWKSFKKDAGGVGIGTLVEKAKQGGYKPPRREKPAAVGGPAHEPEEPSYPRYRVGERVNPISHKGELLLSEPATVIEILGTHNGEIGYRYQTAAGEEYTTVESRLEPAEPARPSPSGPPPALPLVAGLREIVLVDTFHAAEALNRAGLSVWAVALPEVKQEHAAALQEAGVERVIVAMSSPTATEAAIRALLRAKAIEGLLVATWEGDTSLDALAAEHGLPAAEKILAGAIRVGTWLGEHLTAGVEPPLPDLEEERLLARAAELYTWLRDREPLHAEALITELCDRLDIRYEEIRPRLERAYEHKTQEETRETLDSLLHAAARANTAGDVDKTREILDTATRAFSSSFVEYPRAYTLADLEADILTEPDSLPLPWRELAGVRFPRAGLSVISADSGRGKTTMMLNLLERYLASPVLAEESLYFYTYEEPASHIALKLIMIMSGVKLHEEQNFHAFRAYIKSRATRALHNPDRAIDEAIARYAEATQSGRLVLSDKMPTLEELVASLGLIARTGKAAAVFVDYVQRIPPPRDYKAGTRQLELAQIVQELRKTAVTKGLAVITGSQVNPQGELREAKDIYHEAQVVLKLEPGEVTEALMVKVDKQRSGISGITGSLQWDKPTLRITSTAGQGATRPRTVITD